MSTANSSITLTISLFMIPSALAACASDKSLQDTLDSYAECWVALDARDSDAFASCYADSATSTMVDLVPPLEAVGDGRAIHETRYQPFLTGVPDVLHDHGTTLISQDGSQIVHLLAAYGTQSGELMGLPPSGKQVGMTSIMHAQLDSSGHIVREDQYADMATFMAHIGAIPGPARELYTAGSLGGWDYVIQTGSDAEAANLRAVESFIAASNGRDMDAIMAFYSDDVVFDLITSPTVFRGQESVREAIAASHAMSSDAAATVTWSLAAGEHVAVAGAFGGVNDGPLDSGLPATNKPFELRYLALFRLEDGLIAEHAIYQNGIALAAQLGLLPAPAGE